MLNEKLDIYIHFGPHKSGSTAIQGALKKHQNVNLYCRSDIQKLLLLPSPQKFNLKNFEDYLLTKYESSKKNIISDEEISGNIHTNGNGGIFFYEMCRRLSAIESFNVIPIYICRQGYDACISSWKQYIKKGGKKDFQWYVSQNDQRPSFRFPKFSYEHFIHKPKIEELWKFFSKENVKILIYNKDIVQEFFKFIKTDYDFDLNIIENDSKRIADYRLARYFNNLISSNQVCETPLITSNLITSALHRVNKIKLLKEDDYSIPNNISKNFDEDWKWLLQNIN
jgi:hypothetical protein